MSAETAALILAWGAIAILGLALSGMLRQLHYVRQALTSHLPSVGPVVGIEAPEVAGKRWDAPTVLLFVHEDCEACKQVAPAFAALSLERSRLRFHVISNGMNGYNVEEGVAVASDEDGQIFSRFGISITPFAVGIDRSRIAAASPIPSDQVLREFVDSFQEGVVSANAG